MMIGCSKKILLSLLFIILGSLPYIFFRQSVIFLSPFYDILPNQIDIGHNLFTNFFIYHFSDAAWYISLIIISTEIKPDNALSHLLNFIILGLPFLWEFLQLTGTIPGAFDIIDIFIYLIIFLIHILCKRNFFQRP